MIIRKTTIGNFFKYLKVFENINDYLFEVSVFVLEYFFFINNSNTYFNTFENMYLYLYLNTFKKYLLQDYT